VPSLVSWFLLISEVDVQKDLIPNLPSPSHFSSGSRPSPVPAKTDSSREVQARLLQAWEKRNAVFLLRNWYKYKVCLLPWLCKSIWQNSARDVDWNAGEHIGTYIKKESTGSNCTDWKDRRQTSKMQIEENRCWLVVSRMCEQ